MHKLLERQLRKTFGSLSRVPAELTDFLKLVEHAYSQSDHDRALLERSMDLVSEELMETNADLRSEREALERRVLERTKALREANQALELEAEERERVNRAIQRSEGKYRALFEESLDALCVLTVDGRLLDLNHAAVEMLGFASREQALDSSVLSLYVDPRQRANLLSDLRSKGFVEGRELELNTLDGRRIVVLASSVGLRNEEGRLTQIRATLRDVTDQRALQEQLLQARKMEAVGRLAGGVAHEFNNLLTVVVSSAELIALTAEPGSETLSLLDEIRSAATRGGDLTQRLLAFGRKKTLVERRLDINHVVANTRSLLQRLIGGEIEIVTRLEAEQAGIMADFALLEQVLVNLSLNARDAMPGGGRLEIATDDVFVAEPDTADGLEEGPYVRLTVRDTGPGIDEAIQDRIFEPFFSTRDQDDRPGLGLPTVHGIVRQAGGRVSVSNRTGEGARIDVWWPCLIEHEAAASDAPGWSHEDAPDEAAVVLVVDDDDGVRSLTSRVLQRHGFTAIEAVGGEDALEAYSRSDGKVSVLVSDVAMPGMQGPELAAKLRATAPDLRVLLMSGQAEPMVPASEAPGGGSTEFLRKPFSAADLIASVEKLLRAG